MYSRLALFLSLLLIVLSCLPEPLADDYRVFLDQTVRDRSVFPYYFNPGVGLDSISRDIPLFQHPNGRRIRVEMRAADVVLGRTDSVRIGIIHPVAEMLGDSLTEPLSDFLMIGDHGQDNARYSAYQSGVGEISRRTFFRIGRNVYRLASVDPTRTVLEIEPVKPGIEVPFVAEFDVRYKKTPVKDMEDRPHSIGRQPDRELLLYFFNMGPQQVEQIAEIDSAFHQIGGDAPIDLVLVNRYDTRNNLERMQRDYQIKAPIFRSINETCQSLNCHPMLPFGVLINANGRIVSQQMSKEAILEHFQRLEVERGLGLTVRDR